MADVAAIIRRARGGFDRADWKGAIAWLIFWAYAYALLINPMLVWVCVFLTAFSTKIFGEPIAIPFPSAPDWSLLATATTTLATIGGIEAIRDRTKRPDSPEQKPEEGKQQ
jgi:hypothetical protein